MYFYLALTECNNTEGIEMADKAYETLEEAKEWIEDTNKAFHHYSYSSKIIMINCNTLEIMNVYSLFRKREQPRADIDWQQMY
tara:strand:+ start:637 stop:885 length:249 start_codon:yes stop_codon:yes gene_type:complete